MRPQASWPVPSATPFARGSPNPPEEAYEAWLFRTVVTTRPIEDLGQPAIGQRLHNDRPPIAMLLPIGHEDTKFGGIVLNRMLPTIHRAAVEDDHIGRFLPTVQGHRKRIPDLTIGRNRAAIRGERTSCGSHADHVSASM